MNAAVTRCPECSTRFKVSAEQLAAHDGIVRCGRCNAVFNAAEHLHDDEPSPQLSLPIAVPEDPANDAAPVAGRETVASSGVDANPDEPEALPSTPRRSQWPWLVGVLSALLVLLAQAMYFYRVELAAQLPGLKPALASYCGLLKCTIPLPAKADLMSIESSDLEADPPQTSLITLSAVLHNRATHTQAYPHLELSLTDVQDKVVARRTFIPAEYLKTSAEEKLGLAANRETSIKLRLDTTDLKPTGYKLFLFYPQ
ncbi:MAG: DUF3426 domain-containing protein [Gallionellaceae bacterium]|nr:MAG: DUF3426 domain-containing protein [Gallionellaceae bacterium]